MNEFMNEIYVFHSVNSDDIQHLTLWAKTCTKATKKRLEQHL